MCGVAAVLVRPSETSLGQLDGCAVLTIISSWAILEPPLPLSIYTRVFSICNIVDRTLQVSQSVMGVAYISARQMAWLRACLVTLATGTP